MLVLALDSESKKVTKVKKRVRERKKRSSKNSRRTSYISAELRPDIAAHHFRSTTTRRRVVAAYLAKCFSDVTPIIVDFDLAVCFFLQETAHLHIGPIPHSVNVILADFQKLGPLSGRQDHLYICAIEIHNSVSTYHNDTSTPKPFGLRYPTLNALYKLARDCLKDLSVVGEDKAVVLVDLVGRPLAVGVPPKNSANTVFLSGHVSISPIFYDIKFVLFSLTYHGLLLLYLYLRLELSWL